VNIRLAVPAAAESNFLWFGGKLCLAASVVN
jgi:hypothetical protein